MEDIQERFPLHYNVWFNNYEALQQLIASKQDGGALEMVDPRGRTPLHLAIALGHLECVQVLLRHDANVDVENANFWTAVQEAIATGDPEMVQICLQHRDAQRNSRRTNGVPGLLQRLTESPDFYVEMKWEFTSWVPLVSRVCPSDTYKVWKSGSSVRIDTTLLGFDNMSWQRGSRSYVFKEEAGVATVMEIDHDSRQVVTEHIRIIPGTTDAAFLRPNEEMVAARLTSPIVTTYIDTEKIAFERSRSGVWGWRSDKTETVNGYSCKVFSASNVNLMTKTRTEHLTEQDKKNNKKTSKNPLESFLGVVEEEEKVRGAVAANGDDLTTLSRNPCCIKPEEYFNPSSDLGGRDIGRPIEQTTKIQKFKAQLCLCEDYPLSLPLQVLPIIDLMAVSNAHFRKLKDFITLQLPAGFPVKIEIPLFHVLNAKITFGNIFASVTPAVGVECMQQQEDDSVNLSCVISQSVFEAPSSYSVLGDMHYGRLQDEDDQLLQFAIQQSLLETGGTDNEQVTLIEALHRPGSAVNTRSFQLPEEDPLLQQTLAESLAMTSSSSSDRHHPVLPPPSYMSSLEDEELRAILELSEREQQERERHRLQEEEELQRILELSLVDK